MMVEPRKACGLGTAKSGACAPSSYLGATMHKITLPERCDRAAAEALLPEFVAGLGAGPLHIDAAATKQCGQAMLQLLVSARRTGDGARIDPSPALLDVAMLCGLDRELFDEAPAMGAIA